MVTGVETAGLVLAAIPLAVNLAEHYRSGLKPFKDLRHFRREFQSHAVLVDAQHAIFRLNLDKLLRQIVPAADADMLMKDPGGAAWSNERLERRFRKRLGESYGPIINNIAEINRVIDKLKKGLGPSRCTSPTANEEASSAGTHAPPESLPWWVRVNFSFSRAKWGELVQLLERHNDNIARLLESSEERYSAATSGANDGKQRLVEALQHIHSVVCKLNESVTQSWQCGCPVRHHACLLLHHGSMSRELNDSGERVSVLSHERLELLLRFGDTSDATQGKPWDLFDVKVELREASISRTPATTSQIARNRSATSSPRIFPNTSGTRDGRQAEKFLQSGAALSAESAVSWHPGESSRRSPSGEESRSLCTAIRAANATPSPLSFILIDGGPSAFQLSPVDELWSKSYTPTVKHLGEVLGPAAQAAPADIPLSRHQRFRAALALASSYLYLNQSPWLPESWSKRSVLLRRCDVEPSIQLYVDANATCIASAAASTSKTNRGRGNTSGWATTTTLPQHQEANRQSLRALGIVLLELCFGHALEAHPFYTDLLQRNLPEDVLADVAARHWQRSVYGEAGPDYGQAVHACVSGDLELRHVRSSDFLTAIYARVVRPLERAVRQFEGLDDDDTTSMISFADSLAIGCGAITAKRGAPAAQQIFNSGFPQQRSQRRDSTSPDSDTADPCHSKDVTDGWTEACRIARPTCDIRADRSCSPPTPIATEINERVVGKLSAPAVARRKDAKECPEPSSRAILRPTVDGYYGKSSPAPAPRLPGRQMKPDDDAVAITNNGSASYCARARAQAVRAIAESGGLAPSLAVAPRGQAVGVSGANTTGPVSARAMFNQAHNDRWLAPARIDATRQGSTSLPARAFRRVRSKLLRVGGPTSAYNRLKRRLGCALKGAPRKSPTVAVPSVAASIAEGEPMRQLRGHPDIAMSMTGGMTLAGTQLALGLPNTTALQPWHHFRGSLSPEATAPPVEEAADCEPIRDAFLIVRDRRDYNWSHSLASTQNLAQNPESPTRHPRHPSVHDTTWSGGDDGWSVDYGEHYYCDAVAQSTKRAAHHDVANAEPPPAELGRERFSPQQLKPVSSMTAAGPSHAASATQAPDGQQIASTTYGSPRRQASSGKGFLPLRRNLTPATQLTAAPAAAARPLETGSEGSHGTIVREAKVKGYCLGYLPSQRLSLPVPAKPPTTARNAAGAEATIGPGGQPARALAPSSPVTLTNLRRNPVSDGAAQCLESFDGLLQAFSAAAQRSSKEVAPEYLLRDELGRFRIWVASAGVLRTNGNSLFSSHSQKIHCAELELSTLRILDALRYALDEGARAGKLLIRTALHENVEAKRERVQKLLDNMALDVLDRQNVISTMTAEPASELRLLLATIAAHVSSLLKLSACASQPADDASRIPRSLWGQLDRAAQFVTADDRELVLRIFPLLQRQPGQVLLSRLATAVALRRRLFKRPFQRPRNEYDEMQDADAAPRNSGAAAPPPAASSIASGANAAATCISPSTGVRKAASMRRRVFRVRLPEGAMHGVPLSCPFCLSVVTTTSDSSWKNHVFNDIRPYVCTLTACSLPTKMFASRRAWFGHELAAHRRLRQCRICVASNTPLTPASEPQLHDLPKAAAAKASVSPSATPTGTPLHTFTSTAALDHHLREAHFPPSRAPQVQQQQLLTALRDACEKPVAHFQPADCPICAGTAWSEAELDKARCDWRAGLAAALAHDAGKSTTAAARCEPGAARDAAAMMMTVPPARFARHVGRHLEQLALGALLPDCADVIAVTSPDASDTGLP